MSRSLISATSEISYSTSQSVRKFIKKQCFEKTERATESNARKRLKTMASEKRILMAKGRSLTN